MVVIHRAVNLRKEVSDTIFLSYAFIFVGSCGSFHESRRKLHKITTREPVKCTTLLPGENMKDEEKRFLLCNAALLRVFPISSAG